MTSRLISNSSKITKSAFLRSRSIPKPQISCPFAKFNEKAAENIFKDQNFQVTDFELQAIHQERLRKDDLNKQIVRNLVSAPQKEQPTTKNDISLPGVDKLKNKLTGKKSPSSPENENKNVPDGPQPPAPSGDIFKKISSQLKRDLTNANEMIARPGYFPEGTDKFIHEDVVVKITCHLRDYYDKRGRLQSFAIDGPPGIQKMKKDMDKKVKKMDKDAPMRKQHEKVKKIDQQMKEFMKTIASYDPTGSSQTLFDKDKRYTHLKIQGKENLKKEMKDIALFVKMNLLDFEIDLLNHSNNVDDFIINSKLKFSSKMDAISMTLEPIDLRFYADFTVDRRLKKIVKIEVTDVQKGKSAKDKIKDALNSVNQAKAGVGK